MWKKTETYIYAGKETTHFAGMKVGRFMVGYRKVRDNYPELLENLEVYSQPAACVDSIIMTWMIESQYEAFPSSLWLRDMMTVGTNETVQQAAALSGQMLGHIQGGTTSLVQTTDTDMSHSFKCDLSNAMTKLLGMPERLHSVALQILTIVAEAHAKQMERQQCDPWILKASRRNGWLTWRPNLHIGKLELAGSQAWAADMPEASHRIPADWFLERDTWLDEAGEPRLPNVSSQRLEC
jgi:hypothetical protein